LTGVRKGDKHENKTTDRIGQIPTANERDQGGGNQIIKNGASRKKQNNLGEKPGSGEIDILIAYKEFHFGEM